MFCAASKLRLVAKMPVVFFAATINFNVAITVTERRAQCGAAVVRIHGRWGTALRCLVAFCVPEEVVPATGSATQTLSGVGPAL